MAYTFNTQSGLTNLGGGNGYAGTLVQNSALPVLFSIGFRLDDLNQSATLAALFDQYRIERIKVHFRSRNNAISVFNTASPNNAVPAGYLVVDRDDATAPVSIAALTEYDNAVAFGGAEDASVELSPSLTPAVFAAGAFSGYAITDASSVWLDMANTAIPTFGVKGGIGSLAAATTSAWTWDVSAEYVVSFRKTR